MIADICQVSVLMHRCFFASTIGEDQVDHITLQHVLQHTNTKTVATRTCEPNALVCHDYVHNRYLVKCHMHALPL